MKKFAKIGLDLLYPKKCMNCEKILGAWEGLVCENCKVSLPYIGEDFCLKCGKHLEDKTGELCGDCEKRNHLFVQNRGVFRYDNRMKRMIYRFKYKNQRYYSEFFADEIFRKFGGQIMRWQVDGMIPIPLHKSRQRVRGFNQAEEILKNVSCRLKIPMYNHLVIREKKTLPQKILNEKGREKNLKNAFKMVDNGVKLKGVLLLDDIYTTGSTLDALAKTLLEAGVERVYALCLCIGEGS